MIYNEAYEAKVEMEKALFKKWDKALNGIQDQHKALTTAVLLENYLNHLHDDVRLIAEDQVTTGAFSGVNLALLGLISRVIPSLVGLELVGSQAMPTPRSPIFTMQWYKDNNKGGTTAADEMWAVPAPINFGASGLDPYYTSQNVMAENVSWGDVSSHTLVWANVTNNKGFRPVLLSNTMWLTSYDAAGAVLAVHKFAGVTTVAALASGGHVTGVLASGGALSQAVTIEDSGANMVLVCASGHFHDLTAGGTAITSMKLEYEYAGEGEGSVPEISFKITENNVTLIRRQLRGKYTLDAAYDIKVLHGISIENEMMNMMKIELQAEINREIINDLRSMAGIIKTLDFAALNASNTEGISIAGNYQDAHRVLLDAIEQCAAEIWNLGRLGRGNWVVGNPTTLAFLDRTPGFVGSGITYNGRDLSYAGSLGGKIKVYLDPLYPKNELLIGFKGTGALESGYIYAPYLPIQATPTLLNPETGDPSKIFYTRYGKTWYVRDPSSATGASKQLILYGAYQYARLILSSFPAIIS